MNEQKSDNQKEEFAILLVKAVDGELTLNEKQRFEHLLQHDSTFASEWIEQKKLKEVTQTMKLPSPPVEIWDSYWLGVYNRLERGIAWILFSIGSIIILTYTGLQAIQSFIADTEMSGALKLGVVFLLAGSVALLISVIREKLRTWTSDPYKEIKR